MTDCLGLGLASFGFGKFANLCFSCVWLDVIFSIKLDSTSLKINDFCDQQDCFSSIHPPQQKLDKFPEIKADTQNGIIVKMKVLCLFFSIFFEIHLQSVSWSFEGKLKFLLNLKNQRNVEIQIFLSFLWNLRRMLAQTLIWNWSRTKNKKEKYNKKNLHNSRKIKELKEFFTILQ